MQIHSKNVIILNKKYKRKAIVVINNEYYKKAKNQTFTFGKTYFFLLNHVAEIWKTIVE